ncbi:DNA repair protein RadC OS=Eoetvoesiella caeni OX=645616 GN=DFR37_111129 PE=4 SV=1 [Eoetvoesiella caeni]
MKEHLLTLYRHYEHEVFAILLLDNTHRLIGLHELFRGTINSAVVHPREVVKLALQHNAAAASLLHNHPSGNPEPSQDDINITKLLKDTLELISVRVVDHIVVGAESCTSMAQQGML